MNVFLYMKQELLICVPHTKKTEKELKKEKVVCKCDKKQETTKSTSFICNICDKSFKDERCLKIHKTKMDHWGTPSDVSISSSMFRQKSSSSSKSNKSKNSQKRKQSNSPKLDKKKLKK